MWQDAVLRMSIFGRFIRVVLICLLIICAIFPLVLFELSFDNENIPTDLHSPRRSNNVNGLNKQSKSIHAAASSYIRDISKNGAAAPLPLPRKCISGVCKPRRYFSTTTTTANLPNPIYYLEPKLLDSSAGNNQLQYEMFSDISSRPWNEESITPIDLQAANSANIVRSTIQWRYKQLIDSDGHQLDGNMNYLPPQFPQWDRSIHNHIISPTSTILGLPPRCCPSIANHRFLTKNQSAVLSEEELADCACRSPRNYPKDGNDRPTTTIVTAFYEMSSKHPVRMYQKTSGQLLATADPMIIFCEPNSTWVNYFIEQRQHAPTIVVPLTANNLRLKQNFPQETFWKNQYNIDPEGTTHHKNVNTMLYIIWDEKLILLHSAAMLNPFNTTQFAWVDTGYFRNPAPHAYRQSIVRINITKEGVSDESTLLFQMIPYNYKDDAVISGNQVLVGGNSFIGTYHGIDNLYSAFYDTFWTMAATGQFVGSDQKVMYRTCHTFPTACHIHHPKKDRQWLKMLGELLPGVHGGEKIGEPLKLHNFTSPDDNIPIPPNGIVDDATSDLVWKGVERRKGK